VILKKLLYLATEVLRESSDLDGDGVRTRHVREAVRRMQREGKLGLVIAD